jgi:hypothetical protein
MADAVAATKPATIFLFFLILSSDLGQVARKLALAASLEWVRPLVVRRLFIFLTSDLSHSDHPTTSSVMA